MINPYKKNKQLEKEIKELKGIPNTSIHPQYKRLIQEVREIDGRMLYQFKDLLDMAHNRYNSCMRFTTEVNMKIDADILKAYNKTIKETFEKILESSDLGKTRKLSHKGLVLEETITMHLDMLISIESSYRLASCVYFWEDENLDEYDYEIGDEKIRLFKEVGLKSFFLSKPMNNFLPPMTISEDVLIACSQYQKQLGSLLSNQLKKETE